MIRKFTATIAVYDLYPKLIEAKVKIKKLEQIPLPNLK